MLTFSKENVPSRRKAWRKILSENLVLTLNFSGQVKKRFEFLGINCQEINYKPLIAARIKN